MTNMQMMYSFVTIENSWQISVRGFRPKMLNVGKNAMTNATSQPMAIAASPRGREVIILYFSGNTMIKYLSIVTKSKALTDAKVPNSMNEYTSTQGRSSWTAALCDTIPDMARV